MPAKHMPYFDVLEALQSDGCPVCRLSLRSVSRYLDALSYENVNDPEVRATLRRSRGFCNHHAWQFADACHDGLGTAIIYRDVLDTLLRAVEKPRRVLLVSGLVSRTVGLISWRSRDFSWFRLPFAAHAHVSRLAGLLAPEAECPACQVLAASEERHLETLLAHLADRELREVYRTSSGLCLPHLAAALPRADPADAGILTGIAGWKIASLHASIDAGRKPDLRTITEAMVGKIEKVSAVAHRDGCPVCEMTIPALDEWLGGMVGMVERGLGSEDQQTETVPLCQAHAWRILEVASPAVVSEFWHPIVRAAESTLLQGIGRNERLASSWRGLFSGLGDLNWRKGRRPLRQKLERQPCCPACETKTAIEEETVQTLLNRPGRAGPSRQSEHLSALCLPHLVLPVRLVSNGSQKEALLSLQAEAWRSLRAELDEYVRKQDYRFRHEPRGPEMDAPWRAIAAVAGERGSQNAACQARRQSG